MASFESDDQEVGEFDVEAYLRGEREEDEDDSDDSLNPDNSVNSPNPVNSLGLQKATPAEIFEACECEASINTAGETSWIELRDYLGEPLAKYVRRGGGYIRIRRLDNGRWRAGLPVNGPVCPLDEPLWRQEREAPIRPKMKKVEEPRRARAWGF